MASIPDQIVLIGSAKREFNTVFTRQDTTHNGKSTFVSQDRTLAFWYCKSDRWMMGNPASMVKEMGWIHSEVLSKSEHSSPHLVSKWFQLQDRQWRHSQVKVRIVENNKRVLGAFGPDIPSCMDQKRRGSFVSTQDTSNPSPKRSRVWIDVCC